MNQTSQPEGEQPEEVNEGEVTKEFRRLGDNLMEVLRSAWESPERKKLQSEIEAGLTELGASLNKAVLEARQSPTGQRLESEVKEFGERVRTGEVEADARKNLLSLLKDLNSKIEKAAEPASKTGNGENEVES
jgi:hypothetical protein